MQPGEDTAIALRDKIRRRECSAQEVCASALERIHTEDKILRSFIAVDEAGAQAAAQAIDRKLAAQEDPGPLAGVPIALKDNLCTRDFPTTCASRILANWRPPYHATVVEKILAAGAIFLGKLNMDEFAMGSSCETSAVGSTRNPWDRECVPGGSSGGSAAAVAAGLVPWALGSDTGGSIRQPAALCGVVGLKPTYGRVSRYGLVAYASSLDQIGPLAHTVEDVALLLSVIAGPDDRDATSAQEPVPDYLDGLSQDISGLTIGLPREYFSDHLQLEVRSAIEAAQDIFQDAGAIFQEISLPYTDYCLATYYLVATAEASSNLARYDGVQYGLRQTEDQLLAMYTATRALGFGSEVKRRIMLGTYALSAGYYDAYYKKALQVRTLIQQDFTAAWQHCDLILTPTSPTVAFRLGEKTTDPLTMYLSDIFTISANLAGLPAISFPGGFSNQGLPVGLQLIGSAFAEPTLLRAVKAYQARTTWHHRRPNISATRTIGGIGL